MLIIQIASQPHIKVQRQAVLLVNSIQNHHFICVFCIILVIVLNNRGKRAISIRKWAHSHKHHKAAENHFRIRCSRNVTVANRGKCGTGPIHRYDIQTRRIFLMRIDWFNPRVLELFILNRRNNDPEAGDDVHDYYAYQDEKEKPLKAQPHFQKIIQIFV